MTELDIYKVEKLELELQNARLEIENYKKAEIIARYELADANRRADSYKAEMVPVKEENTFLTPRAVAARSSESARGGEILFGLKWKIQTVLEYQNVRLTMLELSARGVLLPHMKRSGTRSYAVSELWRDLLFAEYRGREVRKYGTVRVRPGAQNDVLDRLSALPKGNMVDADVLELDVVLL